MESLDVALVIGIAGFSAIVLATSIFSYIKTKVSKLIPICLAFLFFLLKGFYFLYEIYLNNSLSNSIQIILLLDLVIIILIYIAIAKK